jgi:hypothetical protein
LPVGPRPRPDASPGGGPEFCDGSGTEAELCVGYIMLWGGNSGELLAVTVDIDEMIASAVMKIFMMSVFVAESSGMR